MPIDEGLAERIRDMLGRPRARAMRFTGRPMKGYVFVDSRGFESGPDLAHWVNAGLAFVATMPAK